MSKGKEMKTAKDKVAELELRINDRLTQMAYERGKIEGKEEELRIFFDTIKIFKELQRAEEQR